MFWLPPDAAPSQRTIYDFQTVEYVHTQSPEVFTDLFRASKTRTVRAIFIGDSQETCPGGAGSVYFPRFAYEFWRRTGNVPETPLAPMGRSYGDASPPSHFLVRGSAPSESVSPSRVRADLLPPGFSGCKTSTAGTSTVDPVQMFGNILALQPDCASCDIGTELRGAAPMFDTSNVRLELFAATHPQSGELRIRVRPAATSLPNHFSESLAEFISTMDLRSDVFAIKREIFGPLPQRNTDYIQADVDGTRSDAFTDVIAARFVSSNPIGWSISTFSQGGYQIDSILYRHAGSGAFLREARPDVIIIASGTNDAGSGAGPVAYLARLRSVIAFARAWTRADLPVIVLSEQFRLDNDPNIGTALEHQPAAAVELANQDPLVVAVNSRRALHEMGWNRTGFPLFLEFDGVHYRAHGARTKAAVEAGLLWTAFDPCDPDINQDGSIDSADVFELVDRIAQGQSGTDFNHDGQGDFSDVVALTERVAGGPCP